MADNPARRRLRCLNFFDKTARTGLGPAHSSGVAALPGGLRKMPRGFIVDLMDLYNSMERSS
jgi:hypothetical protein